MKRNLFAPVLLVAMLAFLQACNFPRPTPMGQPNAATATALAATQQAAGVPVTGGTGTPTQTTLSVQTNTNCRVGPGSAYDLVATLKPGSSFLVIGKYSAGNFWIVANPTGGSCWVSGRNATVVGNTSNLPEYPAPANATATPSPAALATATPAAGSLPAPGAVYASRVCAKGFSGQVPVWVEDVVLTWQPSVGQAGYRIYQDGQPVLAVTADSTTANLEFGYSRAGGHPLSDTFGVAAFDTSGTSAQSSVTVPSCP